MSFDPETRFLAKVDPVDPATGCQNWAAAIGIHGYGKFYYHGSFWNAHRWAYWYYVGDIPDGFDIHHMCYNRLCVNISHLKALSRRDNLLDSPRHNGNRTHCPWGHEYSEENTRYNNRGDKVCKFCAAAKCAMYYYTGTCRVPVVP